MFNALAKLLRKGANDTIILTLAAAGDDQYHVTVTQQLDAAEGIKDARMANALRAPVQFNATLDELIAEFPAALEKFAGSRTSMREAFAQLDRELETTKEDASSRAQKKTPAAKAADKPADKPVVKPAEKSEPLRPILL